ncbi:hypothetical protein PsorP6_006273 [Peronosclerospora sorghi]|uniref:Uncharacterized protein n=1 Tax=Peronosclerospora sorghi TaxID=230839 RepID=A0ACC0W251_9STRA|nr:hypothetical protein PsorP6_006273 [Peronosclerospora sorghi]
MSLTMLSNMTRASLLLSLGLTLKHIEATDYPGGWEPNFHQCVDICAHASPDPICPTQDPPCLAKKQRPEDYDFLVMEQIFLPQLCRDLLAGVDLTLSHRNVNKFPHGIACDPLKAVSKLSIHGLWPNYNAGFPACCNVSKTIRNVPFNPWAFAAESAELLKDMDDVWRDPTEPSGFQSLCGLYNHEFQKHGLCYAANGGKDFDLSAEEYFRAVIRAAAVNEAARLTIEQWASRSDPKTTRSAITSLYKTRVNILCSAVAPAFGGELGNSFAAIHVCFSKPSHASARLTPIDCNYPVRSPFFIPCSAEVPITLAKYVSPQNVTRTALQTKTEGTGVEYDWK